MPRRVSPHQLTYFVDKQLLDIVKNGRPAFDSKGRPVFDHDGNQIRRPPTAADLKTAIDRLKTMGIKDVAEKRDDVELAMDRLRREYTSPRHRSAEAAGED